MERSPALAARGHGARRLRGRRRRTASCYVRSEYPRVEARARGGDRRRARAAGCLGDDILGSGFSFDVARVEGAGSYVVGEETALLACLQGLRGTVSARPPFPAERGLHGAADRRQQRRDALQRARSSPRAAPRPTRRSARGATPGTKLVCFNERFARPGRRRGAASACRCASSARSSPAGSSTGARSRRCRSAARSAGSCPASLLDTPFDFDAARRRRAAWSATAAIVAFDDRTDMRALARHLLALRRARELRQVLPVPDRAAARARDVRRRRARSTARGSRSCSRRSRSRASARTAAACPRRSAACSTHFPDELGLR